MSAARVRVYLVRHAKAGRRDQWHGDDRLRPLSKNGMRQAEAIRDLLADRGVARVVSSPYVRCIETVEPLAERLGLPVEVDTALEEGEPWTAALTLVRSATAPTVLCSHGDVVSGVLVALAAQLDLGTAADPPPFAKGSTWVLDVVDGAVEKARYVRPRT